MDDIELTLSKEEISVIFKALEKTEMDVQCLGFYVHTASHQILIDTLKRFHMFVKNYEGVAKRRADLKLSQGVNHGRSMSETRISAKESRSCIS